MADDGPVTRVSGLEGPVGVERNASVKRYSGLGAVERNASVKRYTGLGPVEVERNGSVNRFSGLEVPVEVEKNGDQPHDKKIEEEASERSGSGSGDASSSDVDEVGKVCILTIDGGGMRGIIPGRILAHLEATLKEKSGDPNAKIADFFDVAAGTSIGGIITTMLFTDDGTGRPLFTGEATWKLIAEKGKQIFQIPRSQRAWAKLRGILTPRYSTKYLEALLKEHLIRNGSALTLRDTLKSVLIPCYDLESAGPFVFSRADAMDAEAWDFPLWEVCRATSAVPSFFKPALVTSTDGKTQCTAVDGGIVMNNPTAAAITHVLHNEDEFPTVRGAQDLLVLSLGTGQFDQTYGFAKVRHWGAFQWARPVVKIVLDGISDMVDHTVSMSFGEKFRCNYVRVQVSGLPDKALTTMDNGSAKNVKKIMRIADDVFTTKSMEHLPFGGRRNLSVTNQERLDLFADQLVRERKTRALRAMPTVALKMKSLSVRKKD